MSRYAPPHAIFLASGYKDDLLMSVHINAFNRCPIMLPVAQDEEIYASDSMKTTLDYRWRTVSVV